MENNFEYDVAFNRNIGVVSESEQEMIKNTKISLAGVGGIGGSTMLALVRMGFQNFKIADLDDFDQANSNRQAGATLDAYNRAKVDVMKELAQKINPNCNVEVFKEGVQEHNVDSFLNDSDVVLDCIDFFCLTARTLLHKHSRLKKLNCFLAAPMGFSGAVIGFGPNGPSFEKYFNIKHGEDKFTRLLKFAVGLAPRSLHSSYVDFSVERIARMKTGPSIASAVHLGVSLITTEVLMTIIEKRKPLLVPRTLQYDPYRMKLAKCNPWFGNKSILQRIKIYFALKKYGSERQTFEKFIK